MMAQMKVHGISDKVMGLSSPRTMFFISLEPVKVFCQICPTRFFKDQKDPVFQGLMLGDLLNRLEYFSKFVSCSSDQTVKNTCDKNVNIFHYPLLKDVFLNCDKTFSIHLKLNLSSIKHQTSRSCHRGD